MLNRLLTLVLPAVSETLNNREDMMKILFFFMLIFLFLSCGGGKKTPESVAPDEDGEQDIDIVDDDDEFIDDEESDSGTKPDKDSDEPENDADADSDPEIIPDPCETEPCKGIENSTETCFSYGKHYGCECADGYLWQGSEKGCVDRKMFSGAVCTGQTKCFDMEKEIPCPKGGEPFYGQDAQYAEIGKCLPRSYTIKQYNNGETVIDNNTGLEWQRLTSSSDSIWLAENYCGKLKLGNKDWRLPFVFEQLTIVDSGAYDPVIDEIYFPETSSEMFYSTDYTGRLDAWGYGVDFENGIVDQFVEWHTVDNWVPTEYEIRCVGRVAARELHCKKNLIKIDSYDILLNLSKNLIFENVSDADKNWKEALEYCENLTYAGISDWRLPNRNEVFPLDGSATLWTSTTSAGDPSQAFVMDSFQTKYHSCWRNDKKDLIKVRCVASNPCEEGKVWTGESCTPFTDLGLDDAGCDCREGYDWDWAIFQCVEQCGVELCM